MNISKKKENGLIKFSMQNCHDFHILNFNPFFPSYSFSMPINFNLQLCIRLSRVFVTPVRNVVEVMWLCVVSFYSFQQKCISYTIFSNSRKFGLKKKDLYDTTMYFVERSTPTRGPNSSISISQPLKLPISSAEGVKNYEEMY